MKIPPFITTLLADYFRWTAAGLVVFVLALGYFFVLTSKIDAVRTSGFLERTKVKNELASEKRYADQLQTAVAKYKKALPPEKQAQINDFLPSSTDFPGLLLMLQKIADSVGLKLESMTVGQAGQVVAASGAAAAASSGKTSDTATTTKPSASSAATVSGSTIRTEDVSFVVSGGVSYENFKNFLTAIESSQRLLDVVSLNFTAATATEGSAGSSYSMTVRTYYLPPTGK